MAEDALTPQSEGFCGWCGMRFLYSQNSPTAPRKAYCSPNHKDNARRTRRNLETRQSHGSCPTPDKLTFLTHAAADRVIREKPTKHKGALAYLCPCGFYHVGHIPKGVHAKGSDA